MARRLYVRPLPPPGEVLLSPKEGHHLGRIVRAKPGDVARLFDGAGAEVEATILAVEGRDLRVDVHDEPCEARGRSARIELDVACALPKSSRTDWLFEHGTEAGIRTFRPIVTARTRRQHQREKHWERVLIAAAAQCDRATLPTIEESISLEELCRAPPIEERYVATRAPTELGPASSYCALLVVGPEGGFEERELTTLLAADFAPRNLGPLTLRTETAVLAGAIRLLSAP